MSKLTRKTQSVFGASAGTDQISQFGSLVAGSPAYTTDPAVIQALAQYADGWFSAVLNGNAPTIEDTNALHYLETYQLAYLMQAGVAEYDAATTYYIGSICQSAGVLYTSLTNSNINNALTSLTNWVPYRVYGIQNNTAAAAGFLGEVIFSQNLTPTNAAATSLFANVTSITLTAGDWDVTGLVNWTANGATVNFARTAITSTSGQPGTEGVSMFTGAPPTSVYSVSQSIPNLRFAVASGTSQIVYLTAGAGYSGGTPQFIGHIRARRSA